MAITNEMLYIGWLACFTRYYADVAEMKYYMENGEVIAPDYLKNLLSNLSHAKIQFLEAKNALGFQDELSFLDDSKFKGFEIKDGELIGDLQYARSIVQPWFDEYPNGNSNYYKFEVANLIIALSNKQLAS